MTAWHRQPRYSDKDGRLVLIGHALLGPDHPDYNDWTEDGRRAGKPSPLAAAKSEAVDHPAHYTGHPSGVECIDVAEHFGFNLGNVVKYVWRAGAKGDALEDLRKASWYLKREIARLETGR